MLALEQPWRIPQPRILDAALRQHDGEDRRAVHHHHVAGPDDADAERFRRRIDGAGNDRRAGGKPGRARRLLRHMAGNVGRPQQPRQAIELDDVGGELAAPVLLVDDIERREIGRRIVVDHAFAGQLLHEIGRRRDDLRGLGENLRAVLLQPQDLRPDRLRGQRVAAALEDAFGADRGVEFLDLHGGARIDAIERGVGQRLAIRVDRQHARADGARPDRADRFGRQLRFRKQSSYR